MGSDIAHWNPSNLSSKEKLVATTVMKESSSVIRLIFVRSFTFFLAANDRSVSAQVRLV